MNDVLQKRPQKFYSRKQKAAGLLAAGSLADIVKPSSNDWRKHYQCTPQKRHEHAWLHGVQNAVCSICGKTVAKIELLNEQPG